MKKVILSLAFAVTASLAGAQDIHFSQFNASPLTLNPALTGKLECTYRAALNYRDQWNSIPAPYRTYSAAFDAALWKRRLNGSAFGIGVLAYNDVSGDGDLSNTSLGLSLAYHAQLGDGHILSAGFQGTFVQKNVDIFSLVFANQIGPDGVMLGATSGEIFNGPITYPDLQAGIHWSSVFENFSFNLGGAMYHILEPEERFLQTTPSLQSTLAPRYVGHGGFSVTLGDNASLSPSGLFMMQAGVYQINAGTSLGLHWDDAALYFGVWDRMVSGYSGFGNDAIIALVGIDFSNLLFGFSYDITTSGASDANNGRGGFELSLSYNGCIEAKRRITHCPKF